MLRLTHPRAARAFIVITIVALAAGAACAPDEPFRPDAARLRRSLGDSVADTTATDSTKDSTATDSTADSTETPPDTIATRPVELDSLFGELAPAMYATLEQHRADADAASDVAAHRAAEQLGWPDTTAAGDPDGAGIVAKLRVRASKAAKAPAPSLPSPKPVVTRQSYTVGTTRYQLDARTTIEPSIDAITGTLSLATREIVTLVPKSGHGNAVREETNVLVTVPACPTDQGLVPAHVATFVNGWRQYDMPGGAPAPDDNNWDRRRASTLEGDVTVNVDEDAEIASYDMDLASHLTLDLDAKQQLTGAAQFVAGGQSAARLWDPLGTRVPLTESGDHAALGQLGIDERLTWPAARRALQREINAARTLWRGGFCVELEIASDPAPGVVDAGAVVAITPLLRSTRDGKRVDPWYSDAERFGTTLRPGKHQWPHEMPYTFAMPTNPVWIQLSGTSRRGIPTPRTLVYTAPSAGEDSGSIMYAEETRYTVDTRSTYERVNASASGSERVRSKLRVVYDHTENQDVYYRVEATHDIDLTALATMTATAHGPGAETFVGRMSATLGGSGTVHNPRDTIDQPLVQGRWVAPYLGTPTQDVGTLRIFRRGGGWQYELFIRTGQIAPEITIDKHTQGPCFPDDIWTRDEHYVNSTFTTTETVKDPGKCISRPHGSTTYSAPLTYGAISIDQGKYRLFAGPVDAHDGRVTISGAIADQTRSCDMARTWDPLQVASLLTQNDVSRDDEWEIGRDGSCSFTYSVQWHINVPPRFVP